MRKISLALLGTLLVLSLLAFGLASNPAYSAPPVQTTATPDDAPVVDDGSEGVAPGDYAGTIFSGGLNRQYFVHIPTGYDENTPMPLLISFHGFTDNPFNHSQYTGFSTLADEEGFIALYPAGWPPEEGAPLGWFAHEGAEEEFSDDVLFTHDLINFMIETYAVDPARVYISGFSNGGGMAHRIGCDLSEEIAAMTAGGGTHINEDSCEPTRALPVLGVHGRDDDVTPYLGYQDLLEAIPEWAMEWAQRNGCAFEADAVTDTNLTIQQWTDCTDEVTVFLYTWDILGHNWPPDAEQIIWDFVSQYTLPQEYLDARTDANNIAKPGDYGITITSNGFPRSFALHVPPSYDGTMAYPVVISFHDYGSSSIGNVQLTALTTKADSEDFIAVFPEGRGDPLAWFTEVAPQQEFATDTQFTEDIIIKLQDDLLIDTEQVFVTGFSLGGGMAHRVGCDTSENITAIAVVNGAHWLGQTCEPAEPVPVIAIHTLDNEVAPMDGYPDTLQAIPDWTQEWVEYNGCDADPIVETDDVGTTISTWQNCAAPVQLYVYEAGGHTWLSDFNAVIWSFFSGLAEE